MKRIKTAVLFSGLLNLTYISFAQNVGIGAEPVRAKLELNTGAGITSAIFGVEGTGVSFQRDFPTIGFNQYRMTAGGYGIRIGTGYSAIQHLDPSTGTLALEMHPTSGTAGAAIPTEFYRAFSVFSNAGVCFGKGNFNSAFAVDYLNTSGGNIGTPGVIFQGSQYHSSINVSGVTSINPGKAGGITVINDIPSGSVVMGGSLSRVGLNNYLIYLTTLSIRHSVNGLGLLLIHESSFNNWEWYVTNDNPIWIGLKYNGFLLGGFDPANGDYSYVSDRRLKTGLQPLPPVLDKVKQLKPVQYRMKENNGEGFHTGFIAQEVEKLFPTAVSVLTDNTPENKGVKDLRMLNYSQFFVIAIKAIQEQQQLIAELNKELEQLQSSKK